VPGEFAFFGSTRNKVKEKIMLNANDDDDNDDNDCEECDGDVIFISSALTLSNTTTGSNETQGQH
jgi:hypothetical protein